MLNYTKDGQFFIVNTRIPANSTIYYKIDGLNTPSNYYDFSTFQDIEITDESEIDGLQVQLTIPYDADMQSDFADIRFADKNGNALSYWIESYTVSTEAVVWIKLPANDTKVRLYYGNATAISESDGDAVFDLYDGFENSTIFDESTVSTSYVTGRNDGQAIKINGGSSTSYLTKNQSISSGIILESWIKIPSGNAVTALGGLIFGRQSGVNGYQCLVDERSYPDSNIGKSDMQIRVDYDTEQLVANYYSQNIQTETWYFARAVWEPDGGGIVFSLYTSDGSLWASISISTSSKYTSGKCGICAYDYLIFDDFRVRKYAATEPTLTLSRKQPNPDANGIVGISAGSDELAEFTVISDSETIEVVPISTINRLYGGNIL